MKRAGSIAILLCAVFLLVAIPVAPASAAAEDFMVQMDGALFSLPSGCVLSTETELMVNADFIAAVFADQVQMVESGNRIILDGRVAFSAGESLVALGDAVVSLATAPFQSGGRLFIPMAQLLRYFSMDFLLKDGVIVITPKLPSARIIYRNGSIMEIPDLFSIDRYEDIAVSTSHLYVERFEIEWYSCALQYVVKTFDSGRMQMDYAYHIINPRGETRNFLLSISVVDETKVWFEDPALEQQVQFMLGVEDVRVADIHQLEELYAECSSLAGLEYATSLRTLAIADTGIADFSIIGNLSALETLELNSGASGQTVDMSQWARLSELKNLSITADSVENFGALAQKSDLERAYIESPSLSDLSFLRQMKNLSELSLMNTLRVEDLSPIAELTGLRKLCLSIDQNRLSRLPSLTDFPLLEELEIYANQRGGVEFPPDMRLPESLHSAVLSGFISEANLASLSAAPNLSSLLINSNTVTDLSVLQNYAGLDFLLLQSDSIRDLSVLRNIPRLQMFYLYSNTLERADFLSDLTSLTAVGIAGLAFADLSALSTLRELDTLQVNCPRVTDFSFLQSMEKVRLLDLEGSGIQDYAALSNCLNLISLNLNNTPLIQKDDYNRKLIMASMETTGDGIFDLPATIVEEEKMILFRTQNPLPRPYALNVKGANDRTAAAYRQNDTVFVTTAYGDTELWRVVAVSERDLITLKLDSTGNGVFDTDGVVNNAQATVTFYVDRLPDEHFRGAFTAWFCDEGATYSARRNPYLTNLFYLDVTFTDGAQKTFTLYFDTMDHRPPSATLTDGLDFPPEAGGDSDQLEDATAYAWAKDSVDRLMAAGIVAADVPFRPQEDATRIDFILWCVKALGIDPSAYNGQELPFLDAEEVDAASLPYVKAAYGAGIILGDQTADGLYLRPQDPVQRSEVVTVLGRMLGDFAADPSYELAFSDAGDVPDWAYDATVLLCSRGLLQGYEDHTLRLHQNVTRAEAVVLLDRAIALPMSR